MNGLIDRLLESHQAASEDSSNAADLFTEEEINFFVELGLSDMLRDAVK